MTLSTKFFEALAMVTARAKGAPDLKQVIFPYPYETLPEEQVRRIARAALPLVLQALTRFDAPSRVEVLPPTAEAA